MILLCAGRHLAGRIRPGSLRCFRARCGGRSITCCCFRSPSGTGAGLASCLYFLALLLFGAKRHRARVGDRRLRSSSRSALGFVARRRGTETGLGRGPARSQIFAAVVRRLAPPWPSPCSSARCSINPHGEEGAWSIWDLGRPLPRSCRRLLAPCLREQPQLEPSRLSPHAARPGCTVLETQPANPPPRLSPSLFSSPSEPSASW